jgi:hypothetical protein
MPVATAWSDGKDTAAAFDAAYLRLCERLAGAPDFVALSYAEGHDPVRLSAAAAACPKGVRLIGASTSRGLMTEEGSFLGPTVLGMLGIRSAGSRFGVGLCDKGAAPRAAAAQAILAALDDAGRPGEMPDLVVMSATPGGEEAALTGIADVLGPSVPVVGGTAGDDAGTGNWSVLSRRGSGRDAVAVAVLFADFPVSHAFQGGGVVSRFSGEVTETDGPRVIRRIDGRPAVEVYAAWFEMQSGRPLPRDAQAFLRETALTPLGRKVGNIGSFGAFAQSYICAVHADGGLELLADVAVGDRVILMRGSPRSLEARPARAVESAIALQCSDVGAGIVSGGLMAFCAGLSQTLEGRLNEMQDSLRVAMRGRPFLASFTFGEQGCLSENRMLHGNLMISVMIVGG